MKRLPTIAAAGATTLVVGVAVAVAGGVRDSPSPSPADGPDRKAVEAVAPGLPELVAAFRREQTEAEASQGLNSAAALERLDDAMPGENPALTRRLDLPDGKHANVWPMAEGLCWSADQAGGCAPTSLLRERGALVAFTGGSATEGTWIFVRARDGVSDVEFAFKDGSTVKRKLADNGLIVEFPTPPLEVRWQQPDGTDGVQPVGAAADE